MTVNFDVWGAPETWVDGTTAEQTAGIKFFATDRETYKKAWGGGFLRWNNIDYPTYWGIGKGSIWAQPHFIWAYCPEGDPTQYEVETRKVYEPHDITTVFSQNVSSGVSTYISYARRWRYLDGEHQTTNYPLGNAVTRKIWALFDYSKILAIPYVKCCAISNSYGSVNTYTLYEYFNDSLYNSFPEILAIGYRTRYGDGVNINRGGETSTPALLINHDFEGADIRYNNKPYFAGVDGMSLLLESAYETCVIPCGLHRTDQTSDATVGDSDTGFRFKYCVDTGTSIDICYFDDNNSLWKIAKKQRVSSNKTIWDYYPYIECTAANADDVRDYLIKQIAFLGLPFVIDPDKGARGQIGETGVYLPKFDNKGVTTGEYLDGAESLTLPNSQWTDGRESGYDPNAGEDDDGDTGNINNSPNPSNRFGARGLKIWALYQQNVDEVLQRVNELYLDSQTPVESWQTDFKGVNPSDYIVGLYAMLLNPDKSANTETFQLGVVDFDGELNYYRYNDANYFSCGRITVPAKNNFLDYEPYTTAELYLPLCGTVDIDMKFFAGHEMEIIYYYDPLTMSCTAAIYRISSSGTTLYKTANGTIGASIPVTSMQMGTYQNKIHALEAAQKQNEMRLATSALALGIGGAAAVATGGASLIAAGGIIGGAATLASGIEQGKNIEYEIEHTPPAISQTGTAEPQNGFCVGDLVPKLFIKRAKMLTSYDAETYGKTVGFACCINSTVGAFSGFTVYSNVDLSGIPATKTEIDIIRSKLNSGVYI